MRNLIVGTAGHVDHGKTSLVRILTGIETDTLIEEKKRGLTIEAGFAHYTTSSGKKVGIVDVPGHEKFIKNMVAGAVGIDFIIFVIACDDGIMPQTREHLNILKFLNVKKGIIVLTKIDLVSKEKVEKLKEDVLQITEETFLKNAKLIELSSKTLEGYNLFKETLDQELDNFKILESSRKNFRLFIDRVFSVNGFGTVVTGTSLDGEVCIGDILTHYPSKAKVRVKGIQNHGEKVDKIAEGSRTALNLKGIEVKEIQRGDLVSIDSDLKEEIKIVASFAPVIEKNVIKNNLRVRVHLGTREIIGRLRILRENIVEIRLEKAVIIQSGDRGVVRRYSPAEVIGGIEIISLLKIEEQKKDKIQNELKVILNKNEKKLRESILNFYKKKGFVYTSLLEIEEQ